MNNDNQNKNEFIPESSGEENRVLDTQEAEETRPYNADETKATEVPAHYRWNSENEKLTQSPSVKTNSELNSENTCRVDFNPPAKKPKKKNSLKIFAAVMTILCVVSMVSLIFVLSNGEHGLPFTGNESGETDDSTLPGEQVSVKLTESPNSNDVLSLQEICDKLDPSCVSVVCEVKTAFQYGTSLGSGFVVTEDGYIVTNYHVIEDATSIKVVQYDGTEYTAELVGGDSIYDIAVLKVDAKDLKPVEIGSSDTAKVGDMVVAIGSPHSIEFAGTHTFGYISAVNREVNVSDSGSLVKKMTMLQTDATLNPGNSGGPLVNMQGQVIGINTMKLVSQYEGMGFAIPMSKAVDLINQIIEHGEIIDRNDSYAQGAAYLGINYSEVNEATSEYYHIPQGVMVTQIDSSASAYEAGLRRGDIICGFNGQTITNSSELISALAKANAGDEATLKIFRDSLNTEDKTMELKFKLDAKKG